MHTPLMKSIADESNLHNAWRKVRSNQGTAGVDAVSLDRFAENLTQNLQSLARSLREETYLPLPLRRVTVPKRSGGERELAIPTVADRVAQRAVVNVLEPIFEQVFLPCAFGYRPGRSVQDAVERVLNYRAAGLDWILDADVQDFFPSVDHGLLLEKVRRHVRDRATLRVIGLWLEAGALESDGDDSGSLLAQTATRVCSAGCHLLGDAGEEALEADFDTLPSARTSDTLRRFGTEAARLAWEYRKSLIPLLLTKGVLIGSGLGLAVVGTVVAGQLVAKRSASRPVGTAQGSPLSPLLSNIYLHDFDVQVSRAGLRLVRYADDFVICCPSQSRAQQARSVAGRELTQLRLKLHPEKTRIVSCRDPFQFLGYGFDADGAFPIEETISPAPCRMEATAQMAQAARKALRTGAERVRKSGAETLDDLRERFEEMPIPKGGGR